MQSIIKIVDSYEVKIFIGVDRYHHEVVELCEQYCSVVGLCVTVTKTCFAYRGGNCEGAIIGLINYGRFPKSKMEIWDQAINLAGYLREEMNQGSFTVQDSADSYFYSTRKEDGCEG